MLRGTRKIIVVDMTAHLYKQTSVNSHDTLIHPDFQPNCVPNGTPVPVFKRSTFLRLLITRSLSKDSRL